MGEEAKQFYYTQQEERAFYLRLQEETKLLKSWIKGGHFQSSPMQCGNEAEGWIIDGQGLPFACSDRLLKDINDPRITPELSKFNFEINGSPFAVNHELAHSLEKDFYSCWKKCSDAAARHQGKIILIGTYPDLTQVPFGIDQIFPHKRYHALNDRIQALRKGPARIRIKGREALLFDSTNIVFEAQATSLQIHLQVDLPLAKDFYNAALIISPVMSALCANAPYVFGKELWSESRIPVFEQSVSLRTTSKGRQISRVGLGRDFVQKCIFELFEENLSYPILLPEINSEHREELKHLLFHNGTIWRWNRPIIGIDEKGFPHFRIEHRVPSAGPTLVDMQANILFFIGLIHFVTRYIKDKGIPFTFKELENSFYRCSQLGLASEIKWIDGKVYQVAQLISQKLTPLVWDELRQLSVECGRTDYLINDVIKNRAYFLKNGSAWQKSFISQWGKKFNILMQHYWQYQNEDRPVYQWSIKE